jgi:hypothetical protein
MARTSFWIKILVGADQRVVIPFIQIYRFGDSCPRVLEPKDGGVSEGRAYLEDTVKIVQTSANVGNCGPFFNGLNTRCNTGLGQDLGYNQTRHLK